MLYTFLRPKGLFTLVFAYLAAEGNLDDVLKLVAFGISDLPKEDYVIKALHDTLDTMFTQTSKHELMWGPPEKRNREFEQRHLVVAEQLWLRLRSMEPFDEA